MPLSIGGVGVGGGKSFGGAEDSIGGKGVTGNTSGAIWLTGIQPTE